MLTRRFLALLFLTLAIGVADAAAQSALSWAALGRVRAQGNRPVFDRAVTALNGRAVRLTGFMLPLEQNSAQSYFLLTAIPMTDCFYCIPNGPESFVEVRMARPTAFTYNRITITGRFQTLATDPVGFYKITGGQVAR